MSRLRCKGLGEQVHMIGQETREQLCRVILPTFLLKRGKDHAISTCRHFCCLSCMLSAYLLNTDLMVCCSKACDVRCTSHPLVAHDLGASCGDALKHACFRDS